MRLNKVIEVLEQKHIRYDYHEEDECASVDFYYRGLSYHVWEYIDGVRGAETNVFSCGRSEDLEDEYEERIAAEIKKWAPE